MTETPIATSEITNDCSCVMYDDNGEPTDEPTSYCYGDCWDDAVAFFTEVTNEFREKNETDWWKVDDIRLWNGEVSGYFHATQVEDILHNMAVRGSWIIRYSVFPDRIEYSLSHHDAPTGSTSVLRGMTQEELEQLW